MRKIRLLRGYSYAKDKTVDGVNYARENATPKNVAMATGAVALASLTAYAGYQYSNEISAPFISLYETAVGKTPPPPPPPAPPKPELTDFEKFVATANEWKDAAAAEFNKQFDCAKGSSADLTSYPCQLRNYLYENLPFKAVGLEKSNFREHVGKIAYGISRLAGFAAFGRPRLSGSVSGMTWFTARLLTV